jgi:hypothetical protein
MMGGSGSSSGGSGFGSSGGGTTTSQCTGSTTCTNGQMLETCLTLVNGVCTQEYYQVGNQVFSCASCTDTSVCQQEASAACQ